MRDRFLAVYTAVLTDVMDTRGLRNQTLPWALRPLAPGMRLAGPAFTMAGRPAAGADHERVIRSVLTMLGEVPADHVAVYATGHDVSAHLGELSVTSLQARGCAGAVLDGGCRDVDFIVRTGFPVFSRFVTPEDSTWRWELTGTGTPIEIGGVRIEPGDWIVADADGVVSVPAAIAEQVLAEAEAKAATESEIRVAVRDGMLPLEAYERFGTF